MGAMSVVFVTEAERYQGVYSTVNNLRLSLLHNKNFQKPYLDLLKTLYRKENRGLPNVKHIPAKAPTDPNIFMSGQKYDWYRTHATQRATGSCGALPT
jgi:hypothetical protein